MEPGTLSPEELIADIEQGFYVTELMGMGVNGVTGDYSRGAAGFWIENGKIAFPVSEVTIAGNLKDMFRQPDARQRSGVPLRHQRADLRIEGMTIAGRLNDSRDLSCEACACARRARSRGKFYGGDYKRWNKAGGSPVTEADLAVDAFLKEHLLAARPDYGWLSEESADDPARLTADASLWWIPIDGTVAFSRAGRISPSAPRWWKQGRPIARRGLQSHHRGMFHRAHGRRRASERRAHPCQRPRRPSKAAACWATAKPAVRAPAGRRCMCRHLQLHRLSRRAGGGGQHRRHGQPVPPSATGTWPPPT